MKSAHRHELETNVLAHGLEVYIERYRPYFSKIALGILALIAILFIWSYVSGSSAKQQGEAWDEYNQAVGSSSLPNLDQLRRAAEENPNTAMQRMADTTWADGQLYVASKAYIPNRAAAKEALDKAAGAYLSVIQSSDDERLTGRARLGLARVYELQNELDKARATYSQVTGPYAAYAKAQAERLAKPEAKETYGWLATARPPAPRAPMGPGTPGQRPEFAPGDIALPNSNSTGADNAAPGETKAGGTSFDELLKNMRNDTKQSETGDRYKTDAAPASGGNPPPGGTAAPDSKSAEPPAKSEATKGGDSAPGVPAKEKSAK
jgi:predicted negative regulator of RcsB-dependent stress response